MMRILSRRSCRSESKSQQRRKARFFPRFDEFEAREMLSAAPLVVGPDAGGPPRVKVYNAAGGLLNNFLAFEASFTGGVRVASGDVTVDGVTDIVAGKGPGGGSLVRVFDVLTRCPTTLEVVP